MVSDEILIRISAKFEDLANGTNKATASTTKLRAAMTRCGNIFSKVTNIFKKHNDTMGKGLQSTVFKAQKLVLGLLGVRTVMSMLTKSVNAYLSFDSELQDSITNSWNMLGSLLAPAIELVAQLFAMATNYIYEFVKALTGIDLVARANAKALDTQAKKTKEAANAQRGLLGMDEITNLPTESALKPANQISIGPIDSMSIFNDILDALKNGEWHLAGEIIAHGIDKALGSINWDSIQSGAKKFGTNLASFFNGLFELNWTELGNTLGSGLQTTFDFAFGFVEEFEFGRLGSGIGRAINGFLNNIKWDELAITISDGIIGILNIITSMFVALDENEATNDIITFINKIKWKEIAIAALRAFGTTFKSLDKILSDVFGGVTAAIIEGIVIALTAMSVIIPIINFAMMPMSLTILAIGLAVAVVIALIILLVKNWDAVVDGIKLGAKAIVSVFFALLDSLAALFGVVWDVISEPFKNLWEMISDFIDGIITEFSFFVNAIKLLFKGDLLGAIKSVAKGIASAFITAINVLIDGFNAILNPVRTLIVALGTVMGKSWSLDTVKVPRIPLPKFDVGTNYVEKDMLAIVHEGEQIVPKAYNPNASGYDNQEDNRQMIDLLISLNANLIDYAERPININMNGKKVAEGIYSDMEQIRNNRNTTNVVTIRS